MVRDEIGWAPNVQEYIDWLEEKVLNQLNEKPKFKTTFERQMEGLAKIKVKNPLDKAKIIEIKTPVR